MKKRFEEIAGRRRLIDVLKMQSLVEHDAALAETLASEGELVEFEPGTMLIEQDSPDNALLFILDGNVDVLVNGRSVASRGPRDSIGEMALLDGSARRSASIIAKSPVCALRLQEIQFFEISQKHPTIWRSIARVVAERLRQRIQFHRPPNELPHLFMGSSVEGLGIVKQLQLGLKHARVETQPWTGGVFGPGGTTVDSLLSEVERSDFAVFVFSPDDVVRSRDADLVAPRDNVVFELGLFMGKLGPSRCFVVHEQGADLKIPSDLLGVTPLTYVQKSGSDLSAPLATLAVELEQAIGRLGVR